MAEIIPGNIKRSRRLWTSGALFLFMFVFIPSISFASAEARIEGKKNVLILNSYHEGFKWTDDITRGVIAALEPVRGETRIFIEYLDTKWVKDDLYFRQLRQILKHKYARTRFDLIVSSDNDAFNLLREYRDEMFGKIPVVFNGVNYFKQSDLAGTSLFTGVSETADLRESLELALRLHPSVKRIFVINDLGISGRKVKDELEKLAPSFHGRARFEYETSADLETILKDVESLSQDTLIFYTFFYGDPARTSYENSECISRIQRHARVPIYGAWDFNLGNGIVGGKLTSGYDQGITSGRMGLRILKGERVEDIPPLLKSLTRYMFDYRQMARFGIRKSALPEGSMVINGPKRFSEIPNALIWATLSGIASMGVVIFMLLHANRQRKRSEKALRRAHDGLEKHIEERTAELAETVQALRLTQFAVDRSVDQAFWMTNDGHFFYVNDAACHALGYTRDELMTMSVPDIDPTCPPERVAQYWDVLRENSVDTFETCHRAKDGRAYPVEIRSNLLIYDGKEYNCCFATDITERKRAEEALRESEAAQRKLACELAQKNNFFHTLIDAIPDLIFYKDCNAAYLGCNRAFEAFAGRPEQDLAGRTDIDIFNRDVADAFREMDLEVLSTEESRRNEEWIDYPDGRRVLLETLKTPFFNLDGEILGVVGVSRDITEKKRAIAELERTQFLVDKASIGIHRISEEGSILYANEYTCRSLGYTLEELRSMTVFDIDPTFSHENFREHRKTTRVSGSRTFESMHRRKDGSTFPVEITVTYLESQDNEQNINVSFAKDISERKLAEEALRESESRVRRKLESILDPEGDMGELDLADILDAPQIQALMEDLYRITGFRMSIIDLKGQVLVDVGWQPICATFHRTHPETLRRCHESDTDLTLGIRQGEFRTYRCQNNMWHIVTPIVVGGRHMANLFMGQFFFVDEEIDYELFRAQARTYGFPEEEYIAALEAVPRYSEELVNLGKAVFLRLTDMFSKLSYANIKLAHSVAERDQLTATLQQANLVVENSPVVLFRCKATPGWPVELVSRNVKQFGYAPEQFLSGELALSSIVHPQDLKRLTAETEEFMATGTGQLLQSYRIVTGDGNIRWIIDETTCKRNGDDEITHLEGIIIDVTEWKEAEEELRENLKLIQAIMRNAPIILYGVNHHGVFTLAGGKGLAGFGVTPGDYVGRSVFEVYRGMPDHLANIRRALAGEAVTASVHAGERIYDAYHEPVFGDYGECSGTLGVLVDVTEQRRVEEALRKANKVVENSPAVMFRWGGDDEWPVVLVSGNVIQFGYAPDDFLSGTLTYSAIIHPEDLTRVTREVHEYCNGGADQIRLEYRLMTKGGDVRWVNELTHVERDAAGCVKGFEGIVIDVTERKRMEEALRDSQERYRSIVDAYDGFIYICSQDYRVEFMNRKLIERTGRDATGGFCYEALHDRDSICPWCVNERVFAGETVHWEMQSPKDGRWYHVVNVPIYHANGTISKHSVIADIHDLKGSEEKLKEQKRLLQELNDTLENRVEEEVAKNREKDIMLIQQNRQAALGEMLDHIAHQWKQPLTSLSLVIHDLGETASEGELTDEHVRESVRMTSALLDHMAQTMEVFRGFYRPDKEKKVFNIKDAIDQALAFIAPAFRFHAIAVELDVDPGVTAFGYPKEYAQVLLNILANARDIFKAQKTEKPRVIIRAFEEGKKAVVTVTDNGGGIPEAIVDRIFDFYFTTNEEGGGTGIGLYMSRNIIEKNMGGTLSAENTDGGALFRIEISPT